MSSPIILTLNQEEGSLLLNEGIIEALGWPRQVQVMIQPKTKQLLLRACSVEDISAVVLDPASAEPCEISGRSLMKRIRALLGWGDTMPRMCYGEQIPDLQAIRFNLEEAEELELTEQL